jgi:hypothetical protein
MCVQSSSHLGCSWKLNWLGRCWNLESNCWREQNHCHRWLTWCASVKKYCWNNVRGGEEWEVKVGGGPDWSFCNSPMSIANVWVVCCAASSNLASCIAIRLVTYFFQFSSNGDNWWFHGRAWWSEIVSIVWSVSGLHDHSCEIFEWRSELEI